MKVAEHIVRGVLPGDMQAASRLRAAALKLRPTAPREAIRLLELALDTAPDHPERGAMQEELAEVCMWAGKPTRAEELARRALRHGGVTSAASITLMRVVVQENKPEHTVATIDEMPFGVRPYGSISCALYPGSSQRRSRVGREEARLARRRR